jgi:hypothetical protein
MNAYWLYKQDGTKTNYFACGKCNRAELALSGQALEMVERCCTCYTCGKELTEQGNKVRCATCALDNRAKVEAHRLASATLVEDYDGHIYYEDAHSEDRFFVDLADLREHFESTLQPGDPWPEFAFCCKGTRCRIDGQQVIDDAMQDGFEDLEEDVQGRDELLAAIQAFNEANKHVVVWYPDYSRKVAVRR